MEIFVEGLEFVGAHGVYEEERVEGRRFRVDFLVQTSRDQSSSSDDLEETIDYRGLADIILEVGKGPSCFLIERLAGEILDKTFERYNTIERAKVTIRKYATGVPGDPDCVGVSLERSA